MREGRGLPKVSALAKWVVIITAELVQHVPELGSP